MRKLVLLFTFVIVFASCKDKEAPAVDGYATNGSKPPAPATTATATAATTTGTDIGSTMPEYSATGLDGSKFDLATKRNKVVLLNLWATWCGPCRYEIPELQSLHAKFEPKGFEVIGVSVDESGVEPVKQFVDEFKMTYPVVLDPEGKLAGIFGTSVLPTTVLLDRNGKIVWKRYGQIMPGDKELEQAIAKVL
jgi:thiol-disulfide isomerase/thioredoxin